MLDIKAIRQNPEEIEKKLKGKDPSVSLSPLLSVDQILRSYKQEVESLKAKRNSLSSEIGLYKREGKSTDNLMKEVSGLGEEISSLNEKAQESEKEFFSLLASLPNLPMADVPVSENPDNNVCLRQLKERKEYNFPLKHHLELNERLQLFDLTRAAKTTGSGWPLYIGNGARLEWALLNYMLDFHLKRGYTFVLPPLLAKRDTAFCSGHLPKFYDQLFQLNDAHYELFLNPTSEMLLNGLHTDEILSEDLLPLKYVAYTPCFRREGGAAGAKERGIIRMHQFNKVEMFCFTKPEQSEEIFEEMVQGAETLLKDLELPSRSMLLVTGDMSFSGAKTIDVEAFLPGQDRYYEVSSVSHCTDFQTRRSKTRYKSDGKMVFPHTLNGSGLATSRLMVALLENHQQEDGSIVIPKVLRNYLGGMEVLEPVNT